MASKNDPVEKLRKAAGIRSRGRSPKAHSHIRIVGGSTVEERQEAYRKEMEVLARGGADHSGVDSIRQYFRRKR